jgi:hypothetical protein
LSLPEESFSEDLLLALEDGQVIPVIGPGLLPVPADGGEVLFETLLARRLAAKLGVAGETLSAEPTLNEVVCAQPGFRGDPAAANIAVVKLLRELQVPTPEPLRQLAEVSALKVFVSTTVDTLLERALMEVRGRPAAVISFPGSTAPTDFSEELLEGHSAVVFQMLGRCSASSPFAITDGQVLEHVHELLTGSKRPVELLGKMQQSHLLFLGVRFPDWLERVLLRSARTKPLWDSRLFQEFIATGSDADHGELARFLHRFSPNQTRVCTGVPPRDLVRQLHARWQELHPPAKAANEAAVPAAPPEAPAEMAPGAIFISYASEDRPSALRLCEALERAGLDVWLDRQQLASGDAYKQVIKRHVSRCAVFLPLLSPTTNQPEARWFRNEWHWALERLPQFTGTGLKFLFPVLIEALPRSALRAPEEFLAVHIVSAPSGEVPADLLTQLRESQRAFRKQNPGGA